MRKLTILAVLVVSMFTSVVVGSPPTTHPVGTVAPPTLASLSCLTIAGEQWKLRWADEFNGDAVDLSKWSHGLSWRGDDGTNRHHNREYASYILDENAIVKDGQLQLLTQRADVSNPSGRVYHYSQALIQTSGKFDYTYGYCEVRVKVPIEAGPGLWPAFWMLSRGWPPEDDVAEFWTGRPKPHTHQGLAYRDSTNPKVQWDSVHRDAVLDGFHTFGMEWGPGYQLMNRDGVITRRIYGAKVPSVPMYLILNSGVASNPLPPASTVFPNAFLVDYVRVYDRPAVPAFHNAGFESDALTPWNAKGKAAIASDQPHGGRQALHLNGADASVEQTVYGLKPATAYTLSAWVDVGSHGQVRLGVKDFGADEVFTSDDHRQYHQADVRFTTGRTATTASVYISQTGDGEAYCDDVSVAEPSANN